MNMNKTERIKLIKEFKSKHKIDQVWKDLKLPFTPGKSCYSPFRDEGKPSFSVYADGTKFKDHGDGSNGDVISFISAAFGNDMTKTMAYITGSLQNPSEHLVVSSTIKSTPLSEVKSIKLPGNIISPSEEILEQFTASRGIDIYTTKYLVWNGNLKFLNIRNEICYMVTDAAFKNAEIRKLDKSLFFDSKAYPLSGVDKSWLLGSANLDNNKPLLFVEGCTDFITATHLNLKNGSIYNILAVLGASCKNLHEDIKPLVKGRRALIVADGDKAGEVMKLNWAKLLLSLGCHVQLVNMPEGSDITDLFLS